MMKIKVSYTTENELVELLQCLMVKYPGMRWKRSQSRQGKYKKAYIELEDVKKC